MPHRTTRALRARAVLGAALAGILAATLASCAPSIIDPAASTRPSDLSYMPVGSTIKDKKAAHTVDVHSIVTNFPAPAGYDLPDGVRTVILVDVTLTAGPGAGTIGPGSFQLRSDHGDPIPAVSTLQVPLTDASFWPTQPVAGDRAERGWLAFPLVWDRLDGAELVLVRPAGPDETATDGADTVEFAVPLGIS